MTAARGFHYFVVMRKKDDKKAEAISNATQKIVCQYGLDRASIANIAKEASVSPATIYLYFKDKSDLLSTVFLVEKQAILNTLIAALSPNSSFIDSFAAAHKATFEYMWKNPVSLRFTKILEITPYNPPKELSEQYGKFWDFWESGIKQGLIENISIDCIMIMVLAPLSDAVLQFHSLYCSCHDNFKAGQIHDEEAHQLAAKYVERVEKMQKQLFHLTWKALKKQI
ncbi:TetR/AcrR family transcriptional regulator [Candidatus Haliotispira prima]|uniref:TetR/AcrR family transcriptional regulator n=1 Tax=Candidatus Haliotispira prima TaxID=3034016 RepID=A0ABY8MEE3_9SPIO|nr:TetR/AcrR family transcriptional regulator [Candidatus Haliotispira prima]